ncbi:MAG: methyltransferase domain-containing protein [Anaerolineae bacterium]|jgi:ubiquinone/menaquinone biosynthesis C-methylase UbiE|nr:methyltransferase domain-containing protein [Anaerolineae bacterium]MBT3713329.1 methyltransferase domain-containing protein [Anaerolineae bacterium]MBT4310600.1 methyltransferase domain-containing protein [Anaerolineae bacterium]MBT4459003.1 methyltransferase domain-containing protein [Anaerolineae bacterium]MBT4842607.1 methyltransferase domain-containing protein [Anaerolineae bacterium]
MTTPPVCDYEGSDYQTSFWDEGGRAYEDQAEAIALKRLLPQSGKLLLEIGAGAGRNTPRYQNYERVVLLDYSRTQLQQAQERLGENDRYVYVAADAYKLPFVNGLFDGATMIRTLHHMQDAPAVLRQVRRVLQPASKFILEYASKLNLKAILRYLFRRQDWSPFTPEQVEFVSLNFDFHPKTIRKWLKEEDFKLERQLTVSHFRIDIIKRIFPASFLAWLDSLAQFTGNLWQLTPSVFTLSETLSKTEIAPEGAFFQCPECSHAPLEEKPDMLLCLECDAKYAINKGIYDFREPIK